MTEQTKKTHSWKPQKPSLRDSRDRTSETARVTAIVSGRVQGVFFRMHAKQKADTLGLLGCVENMQDGTVRVIAEGKDGDVRLFLKGLARGSKFAKVETFEVHWEKMQGTFSDFSIR